MALIDELKAKSNGIEDNKKEVMKEIKDYFNKYLHSKQFENYIEKHSDLQKRRVNIWVEYWQHSAGCSGTNFGINNCRFYINKDDEYSYNTKYKGVDVSKCQLEIGAMLYYLVKDVMEELGFTYVGTEDKMCWLGYYDKLLTYTW